MRITELKLHDFKGLRCIDTLGPLTILSGPNGSGKTARLEAIRWAIAGTSSLGERPDAAAPLFGPRGGGITLTFDDGFKFRRRIDINRDGTTRTTIESPPGTPLGVKEGTQAIRDRCGDFAPMFDIGKFLALSADKRRDFVLGLCKSGEATNTNARLGRIAKAFGLNGDNDKERQAFDAGVSIIRPGLELTDENAALASALDQIKKAANEAKRDADRCTATAQRLSEQKRGMEVLTEPVEAFEGRMKIVQGQRDEIVAQLANQEGRVTARNSLEGQIARGKTALVNIRTRLAETEKERQRYGSSATLQELVDAAMGSAKSTNEIESELHAAGIALRDARERRDRAADRLTIANASEWAECRNTFEECIAKVAAWLTPSQIQTFSSVRRFIFERADRDTAGKAEYERDLETSKATIARLEPESEALKGRLTVIASAQRTLRDIGRADQEVDSWKQSGAREEESLASAQEQFNQLLTAGGFEADDELRERQSALDGVLREQRKWADNRRQYDAIDAECQRAVMDAENFRVRNDVFKRLADAVREVRDDLIDKLIGSLLVPLGSFIGHAKHGYCVIAETRDERFELGWAHGKEPPVYLDAMSGGETAVYCAGLAYAMTMLADPPLKLMLIEAGEVDGLSLWSLWEALLPLGDQIGNALVATHVPAEKLPDAADVRELRREVTA